MADLKNVLFGLIEPMVEYPEDVNITEGESEHEGEILLTVTAKSDDCARLIGRKGSMASALRQMMSVASHTDGKRVHIQFKELGKEEPSSNEQESE